MELSMTQRFSNCSRLVGKAGHSNARLAFDSLRRSSVRQVEKRTFPLSPKRVWSQGGRFANLRHQLGQRVPGSPPRERHSMAQTRIFAVQDGRQRDWWANPDHRGSTPTANGKPHKSCSRPGRGSTHRSNARDIPAAIPARPPTCRHAPTQSRKPGPQPPSSQRVKQSSARSPAHVRACRVARQ